MQGYSLSVIVQGEATKQAWWIIIQMFSTGTLNGMRSRLASRKILITHLISHRASSAPGGAPVCVCVCVCELERKERAFAVAVFLTTWYTFQWVEKQMRKTKREKSVTRSFFSAHVPHPTSQFPHIVKSRESQCNCTFSGLHLLCKHVPQRGSLCVLGLCENLCMCVPAFVLLLLRGFELITYSLPICIGLCWSMTIEHVHPVKVPSHRSGGTRQIWSL